MFIIICNIFWFFIVVVNFLIFVEVFDLLEFIIRLPRDFALCLECEDAFEWYLEASWVS